MSGDETEQARRRPRPVPLSILFLIATVCIAVLGGAYLWSGATKTTVYVAARDLPAYHQLTDVDVRGVPMRERAAKAGSTVQTVDSILGRYTLHGLRRDDPIRGEQLGPLMASNALAGALLLTIEGTPKTTLDGRLGRGDRVDLVLSPRTDAAGPEVLIRDVLLVDVRSVTGQADSAVSLALNDHQMASFATAAGDSEIYVVRRTPYRRP